MGNEDIEPVQTCGNIVWENPEDPVTILDQTLLPTREEYIDCATRAQCMDAIARLAVRGAPAIGIFASFSIAMLAYRIAADTDDYDVFAARVSEDAQAIAQTRPTAVNLAWAVRHMTDALAAAPHDSAQACRALRAKAFDIQRDDVRVCTRISENGLALLNERDGIITHCNAGAIATSRYGTALGTILMGQERGYDFRVFADETRPLLQGARLTTWELQRAGVDVTLICDNMASIVMSQGWVQACMVGCDRVAANGDAANKIGTSGLAIIAAHYNVPFYVMCPKSTIDRTCATGADIPIELRDGEEIKTKFYAQPMAPAEVPCYNPAFDVTDHSLITAIVTEDGICRAPYTESLAALF